MTKRYTNLWLLYFALGVIDCVKCCVTCVHVWCSLVAIPNVYVTSLRASITTKRNIFHPVTLTFELDLNQHAIYVGHRSFCSKIILSGHTGTHTPVRLLYLDQ